MGFSLSVDKYTSSLDDLFLNLPKCSKIQLQAQVDPKVTQHLKIWKFVDSPNSLEQVRSSPVPLSNPEESGFVFNSEEAYVVLLVYKQG